MTFLLKYRKPLALILILAGAWFHGNGAGADRIQAKWDRASSKALAEKARRDALTAEADAAQAKQTRDMEAKYNAEISELRAGRADSERSYAGSLRVIESRLGRCQSTTEALGTIVAADGAREREDRLREEIGRDFAEVGERANELAATVRMCVKWANDNGR